MTEFFEETGAPKPRVGGLTRQRRPRGSAGLTGLVTSPSPAHSDDEAAAHKPSTQDSPAPDREGQPSSDSQPDEAADGALSANGAVPPTSVPSEQEDRTPAKPSDDGPSRKGRKVSGSPRTKRRARAPIADTRSRAARPVSVYLLPSALEEARRRKDEEKLPYAQLAMDAIDATLDDGSLPALVEARQEVKRRWPQSRFPSRRMRLSQPHPDGTRVLWPVPLTPDEIEIIDDFSAEVGALRRSTLIAAAVEAYLGFAPEEIL